MCDFCEGRKKIKISNSTTCDAYVAERKFLIIKDGTRKLVYDLNYCPECGQKLSYKSIERVYVTNITSDKVIHIEELAKPNEHKIVKEYNKNPLHAIVCDKGYEVDKITQKQVGFIITEKQLAQVRTEGYCDIICSTGLYPYEE